MNDSQHTRAMARNYSHMATPIPANGGTTTVLIQIVGGTADCSRIAGSISSNRNTSRVGSIRLKMQDVVDLISQTTLASQATLLSSGLLHHCQPLINLVLDREKCPTLLHRPCRQSNAFDFYSSRTRFSYNYRAINQQCSLPFEFGVVS